MATGSLYGSVSESTGLYGIGAASGGTYFEWFIFQDSATAPATPTGGSWSFSTNTGTAPTGWLNAPPAAPVNQVWVSITIVDSRNAATFTWSVPGLMTGSGLPILSASGVPSAGTGLNGQLYINTATTPQSLYFKQSGAWTQLTGATLYATAGANTNITSLTGITGEISTANHVSFDLTPTEPTNEGALYWDTADGAKTLSVVMAGGIVQPIGEKQYYRIKASAAITKGQVTMFTGSVGNSGVLTAAPAFGLTAATAYAVMGIATEDIALNDFGYVASFGVVKQINTTAFTDGQILYLDPSVAGGLTGTLPSAPNPKVQVCAVVKSAGNGQLFVRPSFGGAFGQYEGDVDVSGVLANNLLHRNSANTKWEPITGPSGAIVGTTDTQTLTNKTLSGSSNTFTNIPNSGLVNSSVTINGSSVSLGSSILISAPTANSLTAGTGLSGGPFNGTSPVTLSISNVGTAGTYGDSGTIPVITTNAQGQVTGVSLQSVIVDSSDISGTIAIAQGGTGAGNAIGARSNLGIGTLATQDANNVNITGGAIEATISNSTFDNGVITSTAITGSSISGLSAPLAIADGGTAANNQISARTNLGLGTIATYDAAVANGAATLDGSGYLTPAQIPPTFVSGASYRGTWNASTNTPTLVSSVGTQGYYYVVTTAGSTTLNGISSWVVGDTVIFNGSVWQKIPSYAVISGGLIDNTPIGSTVPSTGRFTTLSALGNTILSNVNVIGASYDSVSFSVAGQELTAHSIFFSPDGLKMYVSGTTGDDVNEYNLSTAWVVSSAVYSTTFSVSQDGTPQGLYFRADGLKMYVVGATNDSVFQYTLSTPWSVATASYDSISFSVAGQETTPTGIFFKPNGLSMYVTGSTGDSVYQYTLSTAWDVSTATFLQSFSVSGQELTPADLSFTGDGSRMFVLGTTGDDVNVYNLTTPWDISTAAFVSSLSVSGQDTSPVGIYIKPDGTKMYIVGSTTDAVYQYTVPSIDIQLTGPTSAAALDVQQDLTVYGNTTGSFLNNSFRENLGGQYYNLVSQADIGTAPNEIPLNQYLGEMAYMNAESVVIQPQASAVPNGIGDMVFQLTSDTSLEIKVKGSDGTVRSVTLTLA